MRFVVILLVSFVARSTAETLQVKCGDEKCESKNCDEIMKLDKIRIRTF